jgi:hypothetical protein
MYMGKRRGRENLKPHVQNAKFNPDAFEKKAYWEITSLFGIKPLCRENGRSTLSINFFFRI